MKRERSRLAAVSLVCCVVVLVTGCGSDRPSELGPGVVTPGAESTGQAAPSGDPPTPDPDRSQTAAPGDQQAPEADAPTAGCGPDPDTQPAGDGAPAVPPPFADDDAELDVDGQTGDGRTVVVDEVQLSRTDGFVAVCTLDDNRLLGLMPIARSDNDRTLDVTLDEPLTTTTELLVVLYADNRDGHFDWATDSRVSGDDDDITDLEVERLTYRVR